MHFNFFYLSGAQSWFRGHFAQWEIRRGLLLYVRYQVEAGLRLHGTVRSPLQQDFEDEYLINPLTPNDDYSGHTAPLTYKRLILYIYSTNTGTEYFKHVIYSPFFSSSKCSLFHKSNISGFCIIHILYRGCAKIKRIIPAPKG